MEERFGGDELDATRVNLACRALQNAEIEALAVGLQKVDTRDVSSAKFIGECSHFHLDRIQRRQFLGIGQRSFLRRRLKQ